MSERERIEGVLAFTYRGLHHVPMHRAKWIGSKGDHCVVAVSDQIATWDFDELTRLVAAAHHYCVRVEINASGPRLINLRLTARHYRSGDICRRHPAMQEHLANFNFGDAPFTEAES